jgi:hypothetical protein
MQKLIYGHERIQTHELTLLVCGCHCQPRKPVSQLDGNVLFATNNWNEH